MDSRSSVSGPMGCTKAQSHGPDGRDGWLGYGEFRNREGKMIQEMGAFASKIWIDLD